MRRLKTLFTLLIGLFVPSHFKSPERVTQEPDAPALGSPNRGTFSTQPCRAPSSSPPEQALGLFPAGLSDGATNTSVLAALSLHQQPAAPTKFPRLCCSQLSPPAHSSKPQNGTNPTWSNASLASLFAFKGQKGKGTRWDIYEPVKLAALTRKCSQVSFLAGEGTEQVLGKGSLWGLSCQPWGISSIVTGMVASHSWKPGPGADRLQIWEVSEQKGFGDTSAAPSLRSTMASKQLSAGHKETGLNTALPVDFSHFLRGQVRCVMPPIGFGFEYKMPHGTEKTWAGTVLCAPVGRWHSLCWTVLPNLPFF